MTNFIFIHCNSIVTHDLLLSTSQGGKTVIASCNQLDLSYHR